MQKLGGFLSVVLVFARMKLGVYLGVKSLSCCFSITGSWVLFPCLCPPCRLGADVRARLAFGVVGFFLCMLHFWVTFFIPF